MEDYKPLGIPKWLTTPNATWSLSDKDFLKTEGENGNTRIRQKSAINKYNPEGITLLGAWYELKSRLTATMECLPEVPDSNDIPRNDRELIRDGDEALAEEVGEQPVMLLVDARYPNALSRWFYAANYAVIESVREEGRKLLKLAKPDRRDGRKQKHDYTPASINTVYDVVSAYAEGLKACIKDVHKLDNPSPDQIFKYFPDCGPLLETMKWKLSELAHSKTVLPQPADVAMQFLRDSLGLSPSRIYEILKEQRAL